MGCDSAACVGDCKGSCNQSKYMYMYSSDTYIYMIYIDIFIYTVRTLMCPKYIYICIHYDLSL